LEKQAKKAMILLHLSTLPKTSKKIVKKLFLLLHYCVGDLTASAAPACTSRA
jgi:hypothetical protein